MRRLELHAPSAGELPGLEALLAEDRTSLRRPERNRRLLPACRAIRDRFHSFPRCAGHRRSRGPLGFAAFAPLRLVLEVLVGEKLLFSRRPNELPAAVDAPED